MRQDLWNPRSTTFYLQAVAVVATIVALLYAASTSLMTMMGQHLVHADPLEHVDVMIVLAPALDRVIEAAELYRSGYAPVIVLTREQPDPAERFLLSKGISVESGEEKRRRVLIALGVPAVAITFLDEFAASTADEARGFARWARSRSIRSVMVVTSPPHTARSRLTFLRALHDVPVKVIVRPSQLYGFRSDSWWRSRDTLTDGVYEWQKLVYYRLFELRD